MTTDDDRDSYLRWQELAITQLGFSINLFLTLAGATLAFATRILMDSQSVFLGHQRCIFLSSSPFLGVSIAAALAANVTRAIDFRLTRRAARARMKDGKDHDYLHDQAETMGKWTWGLFYFQTSTFALGVIFLGVSLWLSYANR